MTIRSLLRWTVRGATLFMIILLIIMIVTVLFVRQWSATEHGQLPPKTAVILHAIDQNLVTLDVTLPNFLRGSGGSSMVIEDKLIPVSDDSKIPARIYRPGNNGPYPIILYYHGGAFLEGFGNINTHDNIARSLSARSQSIVISVGYRLAPTYTFPTAIEDSYDALLWANEYAADFGGDSERIAVAGDSAGGNIATVVAAMSRDREGPPLAAQALLYPLTTFNDIELPSRDTYASGYYLLSRNVMYTARNEYTPEESMWESPYTSPLEASDLSGLPSALVITAEFDPLRDEGEAYAKRLFEFGIPVKTLRYNGVMHGFVSFYEVMYRGEHGLQEMASFLRKNLHSDPSTPDVQHVVAERDEHEVEVVDTPRGVNKYRDQFEAYVFGAYLIGQKIRNSFIE